MRSQVFIPLRSNAAWFGSPETRSHLERQIKVNLMLYDRLIFQNGRYRMTAGFDEVGMEMWDPNYPEERRKEISYCVQGGEFGVETNGISVMRSRAETDLEVDFYPIIHESGLYDTACYDWLKGEVRLTGEQLREIGEFARKLVAECQDVLPANDYARRALVTGLLKDSLTAHHLHLPISVDFQVAPFVARQQRISALRLGAELRFLLYDRWIRLNLPNFGDWTWEQVLDARESQAGVAFRKMLVRVCDGAVDALSNGAKQEDVDNLIGLAFEKELIAEIQSRRATTGSTVVGLLLNAVPFGGVLGAAKDLAALAKESESWFGIVGLK